jgi:serine/threonine protein phosphatase PrpC
LAAGEKLFLCSDGLTRHVSDEEIAAVVSEETPEEATQTLIALANERGGEDNISAAVLQFGGWTVETLAGAGATAELDSSERIQKEDGRRHKILWIYTAFLAIVQTILIVLIWILIFR